MKQWPDDYKKYVLEYLKQYDTKPETIKAGLIERLTTRKMDPCKMHPNPEDEFSMESVGPNFEIVSDYEDFIRNNRNLSKDIFDEPVIVEKLKLDGYMLLNGHHRWFAAICSNLDKIRVKIVNLVHDEDIHRMLEGTANTHCAVFDLDEVLLAGNAFAAAEIPGNYLSNKIPLRLRAGAPEAIRALQDKGYDIWIYTSQYYSEGDISILFELYDLSIAGAINCVRNKNAGYTRESINHFHQKYSETIHIDNSSMLITHTGFKEFELLELEDTSDWAKSIQHIVNTKLD